MRKKIDPLIGLDTETYRGRAVLICTPTESLEPSGFPAVVDFLSVLGKKFVCWNADYDVQAVLHFLPRQTKNELSFHTRAMWGGWRLRYVRKKFFTVSRKGSGVIAIYDLCQFYNKKLDTVAHELLGERKLDIPRAWLYEMRDALADERRDTVIEYCKRDALLCERIARITQQRFASAKISFHRPVSCASLSVQLLGEAMRHRVPRKVNERFRQVFRGGRIECLKVGYWKKAYIYDLRSAYPSVMADLPGCNGEYSVGTEVRADAVYAVVRCHLAIPLEEYVAPVPLVLPGLNSIIYPVGRFRADVDLETFRYCERRGWVRDVVKVEQWCGGRGRPFGLLQRLYRLRQKNESLNWAYKIVMNAAFGKLAEVTGKKRRALLISGRVENFGGAFWRSKDQWTRRTNFVYASAVTAGIRNRLLRDLPGRAVIFYATDGVITEWPVRGLNRGAELGQWQYKGSVEDLVVVGSGVYTYKVDGRAVTHFRGFDVDLDLYSLLDRPGCKLPLSVLRNVTLSQCRKSGSAWRTLNQLIDTERTLDVRFDSKRAWSGQWQSRDLLYKKFDSQPWAYYGAK